MANIRPEDIESLIEIFEESDWRELSVSVQGLDLFLSKDRDATGPQQRGGANGADAGQPSIASQAAAARAAEAAAQPAEPETEDEAPEGQVTVRAPNLGTFYRSPKPGAEPYVEVGDEVDVDTEICLIEVMKLFTPVAAGVKGVVRKVCAEDGDMVEHDQPLFHIEPAE